MKLKLVTSSVGGCVGFGCGNKMMLMLISTKVDVVIKVGVELGYIEEA